MNYKQNNWVDFLLIAELETNSDQNNSNGIVLFLATKKYYRC